MQLFREIYDLDKIVIGQVEGHAVAGGCGLVTLCDLSYAVPEALMGYTEVKIGFIPALVAVFLDSQNRRGPLPGAVINRPTADSGKSGRLWTDHRSGSRIRNRPKGS